MSILTRAGIAPWHSRYFPTICATAHTSTSSNDLPASYTPEWCASHSAGALIWCRVSVSALQNCQVMMPTLAALHITEVAVWSNKVRIVHTRSRRTRWHMGGCLEHDGGNAFIPSRKKRGQKSHFPFELFVLVQVCIPYHIPHVERF